MSDAGPNRDVRDAFKWKRLGEFAQRAAAEPVSAATHASGRMRLMVAATTRRTPERRARFSPLLAAAVGALVVGAACLGFYVNWAQLRPLRYEVYGGQRFSNNYVGALASSPAFVKFSDGSEIDAKPGSRLRIDETHRNGARVLIERGTAAARVKHRDRSRWVFAAGPFNVKVIGTKFDLDWDPQAQVVSLTLHEGAVEVESPVGQSHCVVRAGQRFRASLQTGTMTLENIRSAPIVSAAASTTPNPAGTALQLQHGDHQGDQATKTSGGPRPRVIPARWAKLVKRGEFEAVVDQALAGDLEATLKSCTVAEARALADAARYTDRSALAQRVLTTIRSRFPGTHHREAAAFLLGRTTETTGKSEEADRWYARYLGEAPRGEYAAEALAGRMRTQLAISGAAAARPLAQQYLERFPEGVHLRMARRLAEQP